MANLATQLAYDYAREGTATTTTVQASDFATARLLAEPSDGTVLIAAGRTSVNDGFGGIFVWDADSVADDDNVSTLAISGVDTGRWVKQGNAATNTFVFAADFGMVTGTAADQIDAIDAAIASIGDTSQVRSAVAIVIPAGRAYISRTINIDNRPITLIGGGFGSNDGAQGSALIWNGSAGIPMIKVTRCQGVSIENMMLVGNATNKPSAAIDFNVTSGTTPYNTRNAVRRVWIGASTVGFTKGIVTSGDNLQNDQSVMEEITIQNVTDACIELGATQNTIWKIDNVTLNNFAVGVRSATRHIEIGAITMGTGTTAYEGITDGAIVVVGPCSHEGVSRLCNAGTGGMALFSIDNGYFQSMYSRMAAVSDRIINVTSGGFVLEVGSKFGFTRDGDGSWTNGKEKVYIRSTEGVIEFGPGVSWADGLDMSTYSAVSTHFDIDGAAVGSNISMIWGKRHYINIWTQADSIKIGARHDFSGASGVRVTAGDLVGGTGLDLNNWRHLNLNQATSYVQFSAGGSHDIKSGTTVCVSVNDSGGAKVGFLGAAPVARQTLGAASADLASVITLANNIRTALINNGLGQN